LQERIDVESALHVMGRFYATMRQALETQGGHVAEFRGDAVVGLFGFPTVREDDALRAVRAAAAMRDALGVLNGELERDWGVRIGMRVGVNTGEVVIRPEGLAVGDAMNTAARLEQAAPAGAVLVARATWRQVRHAVRGEPIEPLKRSKGSGRSNTATLTTSPRPCTDSSSCSPTWRYARPGAISSMCWLP
jgi:class 3 adenylate cyclase